MNTTHTRALERVASRAVPDTDIDDAAAVAVRLLRIALGVVLVSVGAATLYPVAAALAACPSTLPSTWFTGAIGLSLMASGTMLVLDSFALLAMTLLVPVSMHLLFQAVFHALLTAG